MTATLNGYKFKQRPIPAPLSIWDAKAKKVTPIKSMDDTAVHEVLDSITLAVEAGARYTFADDIDGSNPTNENLQQQQFGNINSNDWYVFTGLTLTYTFGEKPCYCAD